MVAAYVRFCGNFSALFVCSRYKKSNLTDEMTVPFSKLKNRLLIIGYPLCCVLLFGLSIVFFSFPKEAEVFIKEEGLLSVREELIAKGFPAYLLVDLKDTHIDRIKDAISVEQQSENLSFSRRIAMALRHKQEF